MPAPFKTLVELCEKLEATRKRLVMIDDAADFLRKLEPKEVEPAVSMILGRPFPKWSPKTLDVSWATLSGIVKRITSVDWSVFNRAFDQTGDVGAAVKDVFEKAKTKRQSSLFEHPLTILELRSSFEAVAQTSGPGSRDRKERLVESLFSLASPLETKYLIKIFIGEMRTGFHEGLMEQAVSQAFDVSMDLVRRASMTVGDIGEVAAAARSGGEAALVKVGFRVFRPVSLMLAQVANDVGEALAEHGGRSAFEFKYDGARVQIHKLKDEVRIFSRRLTDVTASLGEIVELVENSVSTSEVILEGEVIAVDDCGNPIPFQHLMRRFRRVHEIADVAERIPVRLYLFDVLYLNGESLTSMPYVERRRILAENAGGISLARQLVSGDADEAERFLKEALNVGQEGLMAKKLDSPYTPGIRGKRWLKIKPVLEPLDLAIVGAEYGYGRRHGWLSDYYLAARDVESGEFLVVGKTFKGLTDEEILEMTRRLKELTVKDERRRVTVVPKIVVEVYYNEIQKSPRYKSGMSLRFARINRIRADKTVGEADTIQKMRRIYEGQFLKKGRYKPEG